MSDGIQHKLAAIVVLDVAGYSHLVGDDEENVRLDFRGHRQELVNRLIDQHSVPIANAAGDGLFRKFPVPPSATGHGGSEL